MLSLKKEGSSGTHHLTWMKPEDIIQSVISQLQKDRYCMIYLHKEPRAVEFIETKSRIVVARACEEGGMGS